MRQKFGPSKPPAETLVKDIRRRTRKQHSAEEKIRIVLEGLRGEELIAELCRREGIATSLYYSWSKEFLEAGKKRLAGDTAHQATAPEERAVGMHRETLREGEVFENFSAGGAGWGNPARRDPAAHAADLANGLVTAAPKSKEDAS